MLLLESQVGGCRGETAPRAAVDQPQSSPVHRNGATPSLSAYQEEIERLIGGRTRQAIVSTDPEVEDPIAFALEKHLEEFLVVNWDKTDFGRTHDIYEEDGENGQQYPTDTGPMDILAISKDKKGASCR